MVLVVEMGLGGAKFEHAGRLVVGRTGRLSCGPLTISAEVRHSKVLQAQTGFVYQTGVAFGEVGSDDHGLLVDLLMHEAREQVVEWESNLAGEPPPAPRSPVRRSLASKRFVSLKLLPTGWQRSVTIDPNQPAEGVTIAEETSDEEIAMLCASYEAADTPARELMRRIATVAILERMRDE